MLRALGYLLATLPGWVLVWQIAGDYRDRQRARHTGFAD